jgi:hypothetical protein
MNDLIHKYYPNHDEGKPLSDRQSEMTVTSRLKMLDGQKTKDAIGQPVSLNSIAYCSESEKKKIDSLWKNTCVGENTSAGSA